jgi:hypothetical protein
MSERKLKKPRQIFNPVANETILKEYWKNQIAIAAKIKSGAPK